MKRTGIVIEGGSESAKVMVEPSCDKEGGCASCGGGCAGHSMQPDAGKLTVDVQPTRPVRPGDRIELDLRLPGGALVAMVVFGVPLLLTIVGGFLAAMMDRGDVSLLIGGGLGFVSGFALVAVLGRTVPALKVHATMLGIVEQPQQT